MNLDAVYQPYQGCHDVRPGMRGSHCIQGALGQCKGIPMRNRKIRTTVLASIKATVKVYFKAAHTPAMKIFESTPNILFNDFCVFIRIPQITLHDV